jgi:hypothetical protein
MVGHSMLNQTSLVDQKSKKKKGKRDFEEEG